MARAPREIPVEAGKASAARVYDYLLGGRDHFAPDRELAALLEAQGGGSSVRELARVNRSFILKASQWAASMLAIGQFIDLGCGFPSRPAVHDAARAGCPEAVVVYADLDPVVISHCAALLSGPGLAAVKADVSVPGRVLEVVTGIEVPGEGPLVDLARPACLIFGATLSTMTADAARSAVAAYAEALAPGSAVVISCASYADAVLGERMAGLYSGAGPWHNHGWEDVESFFDAADLRLVRGRAGSVKCWPMMPMETPAAAVIGGIGVRP